MPTYDYVCDACGHALEHFQSMTERRLRKCPKCGKSALVRKVGAGAGLIFKGSGFYETDYKRAPSGSSKAGTSSEAGAPSEAGGGGSDAGSTPGKGESGAGSAAPKAPSKEGGSSAGGSPKGGASKDGSPKGGASKKGA